MYLTRQQLQDIADSLGFVGWFPTSAKSDININTSIEALAGKISEALDTAAREVSGHHSVQRGYTHATFCLFYDSL